MIKPTKKNIPIILVVILIASGVILLKKRKHTMANAPTAVQVGAMVKTTLPETRLVTNTSIFLAKLESANSAVISSKLSGRISELPVHENQLVQAGDLLIRIDDQEITAGITAMQARLETARKQRDHNKAVYERDKALFEAGGLSEERLNASDIAYSTAVAGVIELTENISSLKNQLDYCNIKAPFTGLIGTIHLRPGDLATPGRPLLNLNSDPQKLTFSFVPEAVEIAVGQEVLVQGVKAGSVTRLYDDARNGLSTAEVGLDQRVGHPNGSYLTIAVATKTATGCAVPLRALLHRAQGISVMSYQDEHFEEIPVAVKIQGKEFALIEPCVSFPVAVAPEAKLSLLPGYGNIRISAGEKHE